MNPPDSLGNLEIAHVLFTDLIGYSLLPMDRQKDSLARLQEIVRESPRFLRAEATRQIVSLPTGDGMALVFSGDPTAPAQCALEIGEALRRHPELKLRMGINSGPVFRVADVNANANVAGDGINMAQRVMDCGDAGHILISKGAGDLLRQFSKWKPHLTDLGEFPVKHGVRVHLYNLVTDEAGNPAEPSRRKAAAAARAARIRLRLGAAFAALVLAGTGAWWYASGRFRGGGAPDEASIAVLPFADLSQEKNQTYFSEGLAEELLDGLTRIPGLRVAGRLSSFQFRNGASDFRAIANKLKVANILQGSVRRQGNRARIGVQLIKTADGFELWSETFDRDMTDILAVQQDISRTITAKLRLTVANGAPAPSTNAAAYDAYLQGRYFGRRGGREDRAKATAFYEEAVRLDPGYAQAWAALGGSRSNQAQHNYIPREEGYRKAREAAERALNLDPNLAFAHSTLAFISMYHDWNWAAASASSQKALNLAPGNAGIVTSAAVLASVLGRREEAIALYNRVTRLDPLTAVNFSNAGEAFYFAGRYAEADASLRKAIELAPGKGASHLYLSLIRLAQGNAREALQEAELEKNAAYRLFGLSLANFALGDQAAAKDSLAKMIASEQSSPCQIGEVYAFRGEKDRAFEWLEKAYKVRDPELTEIQGHPVLRNIESDPRYSALLKKIGLTP